MRQGRLGGGWHPRLDDDVFAMPAPRAEHQPYGWRGDLSVHRRSAQSIAETVQRRIDKWLTVAFAALPPNIGREEMIQRLFVGRGWTVCGWVADVTHRHPMHGWLLLHPGHGYVAFIDKSRHGDLGPDYVAPTSGAFGVRPRLVWGPTLTNLLLGLGCQWQPTVFPQRLVGRALGAHALRTADGAQRQAARTMLALAGEDVDAFLAAAEQDALTVHSA